MVVGVGEHFIVKCGYQIDLEEGRTMMFIREQTGLPVPLVYALFRDCQTGKSYIIMERIAGTNLQEAWPSLSLVQKDVVSAKLKNYLDRMRSIPSPKAYCSVGGKPLRDPLFWTGDESRRLDGPFDSESELNDALVKVSFSSEQIRGKVDYLRKHLPTVLNGHPAVFTHADLQRKNIMIRIESNSDISITLLDWETAGWYPSYWEYAHAIIGCRYFEDDWHCCVDRILDPFPSEWIWMQMFLSQHW